MQRSAVWLGLIVMLVSCTATAQVSNGTDFNTDEDGLAIEGYDPVAYFTLGEPAPGNPELTVEYGGVTFWFSSDETRTMFVEDPETYVPAYGAWCAWAASRGSLADIDPEAFVIHEGRLYLNYNNRLNRRFIRDLEENITKADDNWPALSEEAAGR